MRILLAEDDHNLGTWLSRALEHAGIQVEWVNDGRLADRALQQHDNYDALVLDLGLPGLDGQAVLQRLRDRDQRLPALILTARDSLDERVRSLNAGADDFLAKPFELAEVDLDLRGEGTLMGERQKGRNDLKLASLRRDREWVEKARDVAFELVDADPDLSHSSVYADEVRLFLGEADADFLLKS